MATPPYNVAVLAYATSGNTESDVETTGDPVYTLQAPAGLILTYPSAGTFHTTWTYTPDTGDSLTGFKVWLSNSPVPVWGSAIDVGIPANDGGSPTITYEYDVYGLSLVGTVYLIVQAYSATDTAVSEFASIIIESTLPASVHVDGISESVNRICTGLEVNPIGGTPLLNLNGVAVPTVNNLIAGSNITLTPSGRNVTIAADLSGAGGGGVAGAYDIEAGGAPIYTDLGLSDEMESGTLNPNWTVVSGTAGTVDLLGTVTGVAVYDLTSRDKGMLVQSANINGSGIQLRSGIMGDGEQVIFSFSMADVPDGTGNGYYVQVEVSDSATLFAGTRAAILNNQNDIQFYNGSVVTRNTAGMIWGNRIYIRIIRASTTYHFLYSHDGITWAPVGARTITGATNIWVLFGSNAFTRVSTGDPIGCINWIRHCAYTGLDPW